MSKSRRRGVEWKVALWLMRHPGALVVPGAVGASMAQLGTVTTGGILAGTAAGLLGWYRGHPETFDRIAAPRLRSWRRRWITYVGHRWRDIMLACDLTREHRRTGELQVPRLLRVRAWTPSVDVVTVRMVPGQSIETWMQQLGALADALRVQRVAVERVRPGVVALVVQRMEPFTEVIDAPELPDGVDAVDLRAVYLGEDEFGQDWTEQLIGRHWLSAGDMGSGKSSLTYLPIRAVAPLLITGAARLWLIDPKHLELRQIEPIAYRYAAAMDDAVAVLEEYAADMEDKQRRMAAAGIRKLTEPTPEYPLDLLVIDELAPFTASADMVRRTRQTFIKIATQGRASGNSILGSVQEPTKDTVPIRDHFRVRVCLRVGASAHVDMVLGEGARLRGALADEIPPVDEMAGVGYRIRHRSRVPVRVRAAYVGDEDLAELVRYVQAAQAGPVLRVVA